MKGKKVLKLEEYMGFYENPQNQELTLRQLNQIIEMHGFIKLHNRPKKDLQTALDSIELQNPMRSTLNKNISSHAFLTLESVKVDLDALEWQECPVQSIETLSFAGDNLWTDQESYLFEPNSVFGTVTRKSRTKRRKRDAMEAQAPRSWLSLGSW
ncbi:uncharacterized protein LOC143853550 [Tasmannia lanceolata]|uniref:uncharacterized protein LOC143853550 n=1 Tax=Tasmannia lanceolata TaxID=3420 RepID=UPI004062B780